MVVDRNRVVVSDGGTVEILYRAFVMPDGTPSCRPAPLQFSGGSFASSLSAFIRYIIVYKIY